MIKKILMIAFILWGLFIFYKKLMAPTIEPFFKKNTGNVDFLQLKVNDKAGPVE